MKKDPNSPSSGATEVGVQSQLGFMVALHKYIFKDMLCYRL